MKKLSTQKRAAILRCLIEGNSVLSTARIVEADKNTILKFLVEAGEACAAYQQKTLRNLPCKVIRLDELWSFVGCREKAKDTAVSQHPGDVWTWTSICSETKIAPAWRIGDRSARTAMEFCADLSTRFTGELQITRATAIRPTRWPWRPISTWSARTSRNLSKSKGRTSR